MMKRTTDIYEIKNGFPFNWGEALSVYDVGPYTILAFHPWKRDGFTVLTGEADKTITHFHGWIKGKDSHTSWETLDGALAGLIAYRHDGSNCRAGEYFIRSLAKVKD
jgi:hypothetical protein